jgi:hypothetical protein
MGLDIFTTFFGKTLFAEISELYTNVMNKKKLDFNTITGTCFRGVNVFSLPFILKDQKGKELFIEIFNETLSTLHLVVPKLRQNYMIEKISQCINSLLELFLAVSYDDCNYITEFLEEMFTLAPKIMEFASGKLIDDFTSKLNKL